MTIVIRGRRRLMLHDSRRMQLQRATALAQLQSGLRSGPVRLRASFALRASPARRLPARGAMMRDAACPQRTCHKARRACDCIPKRPPSVCNLRPLAMPLCSATIRSAIANVASDRNSVRDVRKSIRGWMCEAEDCRVQGELSAARNRVQGALGGSAGVGSRRPPCYRRAPTLVRTS